ncbi:MAG: hypothetical protein R3A52_16080 [Polyangiales bacterium]
MPRSAFPLPSLALAVALTLPAVAFAQPSANDRNAARQAAIQGVAAHNRGDWPTVIARFEEAERLFHAPIHLRYLALAYEHVSPPRLVEAAETWRRLAREQLPADAPEPFRNAVTEAQTELPRVEALLGRVQFDTHGATGVSVQLDGHPVPPTDFGGRLVAPGAHRVVARRAGARDIEQQVQVTAGGRAVVNLDFAPSSSSATTAATSTTTTTATEVTPQLETRTVTRSSPLRPVGIALAAVGGAAIIGGVVTGLLANGAYSDLEAACPNQRCSTAEDLARRDDVDTLAAMTNGLIIGGGVLAATGVVLAILGRPRTETVQVTAGLRSVGLRVSF